MAETKQHMSPVPIQGVQGGASKAKRNARPAHQDYPSRSTELSQGADLAVQASPNKQKRHSFCGKRSAHSAVQANANCI
ncbi:hypothetical protein RJ640_023545 [Escallonia rubra]|uniref:Uncharacterized protein n=1 Tax=Escallonia rubra TaxID=112253 RepID=A0AA88U9N5_9ASTE|nr:hypothetical protein RJ640_023545 [Escallonia rubra]